MKLTKLVKSGVKPVIRITGSLCDESFGEPGMLAECALVRSDTYTDGPGYHVTLDFSKHRQHNMALAATDFFLSNIVASDLGRSQGNAVEAGLISEDLLLERLWWDEADDFPAELVVGKSLLCLYIKSASTCTYVEWLEAQLQELVPELVDIIQTLDLILSADTGDSSLRHEAAIVITRAEALVDAIKGESR